MHTDSDFFLTVLCMYALDNDESRPIAERVAVNRKPDADPIVHFIFPEYNVAVPLRPGDVFIFNPLVYHGCSATLQGYEGFDMNPMTMYTKAAVVGGNSSTRPLSREQRKAQRRQNHKADNA
jgi:hypothetical protein